MSIMSFCPLIKESCREENCKLWSGEDCMFVLLLQGLASFNSAPDIEIDGQVEPVYEMVINSGRSSVPEEVKIMTPQELASAFIEFNDNEFPESGDRMNYRNFELFLNTKKVSDIWNLSPEMRLKIEKARTIAQDQIKKKAYDERVSRLKTEKEELPALVDSCYNWATSKQMKRVTVADVDAFVFENELDILRETKRALYATTNVKLKTPV